MWQFSAKPTKIDFSTAAALGTGSVPGRPMATGVSSVLGSAAKFSGWATLGASVHIFVRVFSSTWISMPIFSCVVSPWGWPGSVIF